MLCFAYQECFCIVFSAMLLKHLDWFPAATVCQCLNLESYKILSNVIPVNYTGVFKLINNIALMSFLL